MLNILGFQFDFRTKSDKTFKEINKNISKMQKSWGTMTKSVRKALVPLGAHLRVAAGEFKDWASQVMRSGHSVSNIIADIEESFGASAGRLADLLLRPSTALLALGGVAVSTGLKMDKATVSTRREVALTADQFEKYGDIIKKVSRDLGANISQTGAMTTTLAAANFAIEDYEQALRTAISVNRLTGESTDQVAQEVIRLTRQFNMSTKDINDFYNSVYAAAATSQADIADLFGAIGNYAAEIGSKVPEQFRKMALESAIAVRAALANTFENADLITSKLFEAMNINSPEFRQLRNLVAQGGEEIAREFEKSIKVGDFSGAFASLQKSISNLDTENFYAIRDTMAEIFGISVGQLDQIKKIDSGMLDQIKTASDLFKKQNEIYEQTQNLSTVTERWWRLWAQIENIVLPLGEMLVTVFSAIIRPVAWVAEILASWLNMLPSIVKWMISIVALVTTYKIWLTPILAIWGLIAGKIEFAALKLVLFKAATIASTVAVWALEVAMWAFDAVVAAIGVTFNASFWPIVGIIALVTFAVFGLIKLFSWLGDVFKDTFGIGVIDMFLTALKAVASAVGWILKALVYAISWGQIDLFDKPETKTASSMTPSPNRGGVQDQIQGLEVLKIQPDTSVPFASTESARKEDIRKSFGTDDIITAIYGAASTTADNIVTALSRMGVTIKPVPAHVPIPPPNSRGAK